MNEMLIRLRVTPGHLLRLYMHMSELSVLPKNATQRPWPGLQSGGLDPEQALVR